MEILNSTDLFLLKASALGSLAYAGKSLFGRYSQPRNAQPDLPLLTAAKSTKPPLRQPTRSILKQLEQSDKPCMVFYGSQTGTAERFAYRFAREALERYALGCVVADLDDYDFGDILKLSEKHMIVFILATYGEGEPTDNAIAFQNFVNSEAASAKLENLHYSAFGLGSSSYTHYNAMIRRIDNVLAARNACKIGPLGMGDDGKGTLEEDYIQWINTTLPMVATHFRLSAIPYVYRPAFEVTEILPADAAYRHVFHGEPNKAHLYNRIQGPYTAQNPFPAKIMQARELFTSADRSCLHLEFDVSETSISYDTGDHLAIWPENSDLQVNLFLDMFGLTSKKAHIIDISPTDPNIKVPIPQRTTYETAVRHYLDICAIVTRQTLRKLSDFTTSDVLRTQMIELANDKARFAAAVTYKQLTISQLLARLSGNNDTSTAINAPFSLILELIPKLKPRHYSISSSSLTSRKLISITAVVDSKQDAINEISFHGVCTNYLSALKITQGDSSSPSTHSLNSTKQPSSNVVTAPRPLIHVRRSKFRAPFDPSIPIVMIGPGTGVAPFHAFVHERAAQYAQGRNIGRTILFYGCRNSSEDFLYKNDWRDLYEYNKLGKGVFEMHTAFSREPGRPRQYVQDLISESARAKEVRRLICEHGARVYVCGNAAGMAKDVAKVMGEVLVDGENGKGHENGPEMIAQLKKEGRWCEDVW